MTKFWILGGYGEVGAAAARRLLATVQPGEEIMIAGRSGNKAAAFAQQLGTPLRAFELDVTGPIQSGIFTAGDVVINTVETISDDWVAIMAEVGIAFIDVSATYEYLRRIGTIFSRYEDKSLCLTEVGVSPGLTNILAAHLVAQYSNVTAIHTYIEMGMGKHHGLAATKWFFEALSSPYPIERDGKRQMIYPRDQITKVHYNLPKPRQVAAIGVGFSDQIAIAQRHGLHTAQTFVSVAPNWVNWQLAALQRLPLSQFIHHNAKGLASLMGKLPVVGPIRTSLRSVAFDQSGEITGAVETLGPDQSELTGNIAAMAARRVQMSEKRGVLSLPDVMELNEVKHQLQHLDWHHQNGLARNDT